MTVFRFCSSKYAGDISGTGAKLYGGRWNPVGLPLLYTSEHISLGLLELLANSYTLEALADIQLIELEIPINTDMEEIKTANLKKDSTFSWHRTSPSGCCPAGAVRLARRLRPATRGGTGCRTHVGCRSASPGVR